VTLVYSTMSFTADGRLAPLYDAAEAAALPAKKQDKARVKCYSERME